LILNTARRIGAIAFGLFTTTIFIKTPHYLLQHSIPRMITIIARTLVIQTVGRQHAKTHPTPNATNKNSLLHIFFTVNTSNAAFTTLYSISN